MYDKSRVFISDDILFAGADDPELTVFESQYPTEGISYNSYVVIDDKIAVIDTVDERGSGQFFDNLRNALKGRKPDYLIVQHMEPDHSENVERLSVMYPEMKIVGSTLAKTILNQFFETDFTPRFMTVADGDVLSLGKHTLQFFTAPMVHWPEVIVTYDQTEKVLFSADAFGTFSALENNEEWIADASHYYFNIVGKHGDPVQALLKKAKTLDIKVIAPLHGPVHKDDIDFVIGKYDLWSRYEPDRSGIFMPIASIHGNTKKAALQFAKELEELGETVVTMDLTEEDVTEAVEQAFLYDRMIVASATYDLEIFPAMNDLLHHLKIKNFQKRTVGIIENGSWAPTAGKKMKEYFDAMKDITVVEPIVTIRSSRKPADDAKFKALAQAMKK